MSAHSRGKDFTIARQRSWGHVKTMIPLSHLVPGNGNHLGREPLFFYKGQNYKDFTKKKSKMKKGNKRRRNKTKLWAALWARVPWLTVNRPLAMESNDG